MPETVIHQPASLRRNVLLYDGDCGLCNAVVRFLLRKDRGAALMFSPLQGPAAQNFLRHHGLDTENFASLIFVEDLNDPATRWWTRTDGLVEVLRRLTPAWRWLTVIRFIPRALRDGLYRIVARTRYAVFGVYRPRPLADSTWRTRFVDLPAEGG